MPITRLADVPTDMLQAELVRRELPTRDPISPVELLRDLATRLGVSGGEELYIPITEDADEDITPAASETSPPFLGPALNAAIGNVIGSFPWTERAATAAAPDPIQPLVDAAVRSMVRDVATGAAPGWPTGHENPGWKAAYRAGRHDALTHVLDVFKSEAGDGV